MMNYEEFKGKMINSIKEYLPAKYSEFDIFVVSIEWWWTYGISIIGNI